MPEIGQRGRYIARYVYQILGDGALGVAPFGIDYADYSNYPAGLEVHGQGHGRAFGEDLRRVRADGSASGPRGRWRAARTAIAEGDDRKPQTRRIKDWDAALLTFREWQFGTNLGNQQGGTMPPGTETPTGGAAIAQIGPDEFVIVGPADPRQF